MTYSDIDKALSSAVDIERFLAGFADIEETGIDWYGMAEYLDLPESYQRFDVYKIREALYLHYVAQLNNQWVECNN